MNGRLEQFVARVEAVLAAAAPEPAILHGVKDAMAQLVAHDDWLPQAFAQPHAQYYQQYLLYRDPLGRFSVVSFVWGPGQKTPVHDHTVWGVIGMLRGCEIAQSFRQGAQGLECDREKECLRPGDVATVSPAIGDIHCVRNAFEDRVSISIHIYGTDIGTRQRHVFDLATGAAREFISGYANAPAPH